MISPMKKLLLAAKTADKEEVLSHLKAAGVVHVDPVDPESLKLPEGLASELDACNRAIALLEQVTAPENPKLVPPGTPSRIVEEVLQNDHQIKEARSKYAHLRKEIEALTPWGNIALDDLSYLQGENINFQLFIGPADKSDQIEAEVWQMIHNENGNAHFIAASRNQIKIGSEFTLVEIPSRDINTIDNEMIGLERQIEEAKLALSCFSLRLDDLRNHQIKLLNKKRHSEVATGVFEDESLFVLTGWCPAEKTDELAASCEKAGIKVGLQFSDAEEDEVPPTLLKNSPWARSIAPLYEFMGVTPSYNEPDTSGLFLITLSVFSAFLLADAGYGMIIFFTALAAYIPLVKRGVDKNVLKLVLFLFGGVAIYGVLINTWFGEDFRLVASYKFDPNTHEGMIFLQGICFLMGVTHLSVGHLLKMRRRKLDISVLSEVGWIMFLWAMYGVICKLILKQDFLLPSSWIIPLFQISGVLILFFTAPSKNILATIGAGVGAFLKNASASFSDIVSYIRLWAVGLAGGKVAGAFNDIAAMIPMFVLRIPVYIIGHSINIILGVIAILAHGVRLNLLEFSNHLELEWSGRKYDPFKEIK
jgi:V/A-type H+-transporting ATPase subunit I